MGLALEKIAAAFGGGPQAAFIGLLVAAVIALFIELRRERKAHLATALMIPDLLPKVTAATTLITQRMEQLEDASNLQIARTGALEQQLARAIDVFEALQKQTPRTRTGGGKPPSSTPGGTQ